jgi:hypothetical protein
VQGHPAVFREMSRLLHGAAEPMETGLEPSDEFSAASEFYSQERESESSAFRSPGGH